MFFWNVFTTTYSELRVILQQKCNCQQLLNYYFNMLSIVIIILIRFDLNKGRASSKNNFFML